MSLHLAGVLGLLLIFVVGTWRSINLGALALVMTFIVGAGFTGESLLQLYSGFPIDLLLLLVAITYLFSIAVRNGTIEWLVNGAAQLVRGNRALLPWMIFVVAALPTTAGALGSAGVALLAPIALRLAERYDIDRRMIALMVLHGAACGNFSPVNVLGAIVLQATQRAGVDVSAATLFFWNVAYNILLGAVIYFAFGGQRLARAAPMPSRVEVNAAATASRVTRLHVPAERATTLLAITAVAAVSLVLGLNIAVPALAAAVLLHLLFSRTSQSAEKDIAWEVVLLVCGVVTYVALLQRVGTVDAIGQGIAALGSPLFAALLLCAVGALTSAFASSAGILGAMMLLAAPFLGQPGVDPTAFVTALAISATVVDSCPFSTAGALVIANSRAGEREHLYRGLLLWGGLMIVTAPLLTWLLIVLPAHPGANS
jgi:di/tricarboxylate transporter